MRKDPQKPSNESQPAKSDNAAEGGEARNGSDEQRDKIAEWMRAQRQAMEAALAKRAENSEFSSVVRDFLANWIAHDEAEVGMLQPALASSGDDDDVLEQSAIRHDIISLLLRDLIAQPDQNSARAKLEILAAEYSALQTLEQRLGDISDRLEAAGKSSPGLLAAMKERLEALKRRSVTLGEREEVVSALAPRHLLIGACNQPTRRDYEMQRNSNFRERDEQGRFVPEDDRGRSYEREYRGRSEDEGRGESHARSRYEDDDRYRGREEGGRGHGGWFGDPQGHSEASRRGWRSGQHGESGWYGDPRGHSEASRRGWQSGQHGESGWYGDPQGHSEASRRGWDEREGESRRGNGGEYRSRSRYEDERRGHGGWYGDREGHSEASRRGWDERESESRSRGEDRRRSDW